MPLNTEPTRSVLRFLNKPTVVLSMSAFGLRVPKGVQFKFWCSHLVECLEKKLFAYDDDVFVSLTSCRFMERTTFREVLLLP